MNKPYSEWKHDLFQIIGTAAAIAAITIPLLQWGLDAKIDGIKTEVQSIRTSIDEMDKRAELRQAEAEKRHDQWQELMKDVIDAKTSKK